MIWGWTLWEDTGPCVQIEGKTNASIFVDILEEGLKGSLKKWDKTVSQVIFQQDNNPKNTWKQPKKLLSDGGFEVMEWPA